MAGEVGKLIAQRAGATTRALGDDQREMGAHVMRHPIDLNDPFAGDPDEQDIDLGVDVRVHTLTRAKDEQIRVEIVALIRPGRPRRVRRACERAEIDQTSLHGGWFAVTRHHGIPFPV